MHNDSHTASRQYAWHIVNVAPCFRVLQCAAVILSLTFMQTVVVSDLSALFTQLLFTYSVE